MDNRTGPISGGSQCGLWTGIVIVPLSRNDVAMSGSVRGRLLYVINDLAFLISHRLPVTLAAVDAGYEVHIAAPMDIASERELAGSRFHLHRLGMHRHNTNP